MTQLSLTLFADYFQFYLCDEESPGDLSLSWTEEAVNRLLALAPRTIGVGTARNMHVPVSVEVRETEPTQSLDGWDLVNECSIDVPSGRIVIAGCTDYAPDAARIEVKPGSYRARIFYTGLGTVSPDGLRGEDRYQIILWPAPPGTVLTLKQRDQQAR